MTTQKQAKTTQGPIHQVPCPHCGRPNDLRDLDSDTLLDTGAEIVCVDDAHGGCGRVFDVVGLRTVKIVVVRASNKQARAHEPAAQPARAVSPGFLQKLLGR